MRAGLTPTPRPSPHPNPNPNPNTQPQPAVTGRSLGSQTRPSSAAGFSPATSVCWAWESAGRQRLNSITSDGSRRWHPGAGTLTDWLGERGFGLDTSLPSP